MRAMLVPNFSGCPDVDWSGTVYPFFQENRTAIRRFADRASAGMMVTMRGRVRPRDRKPVEVFAEIHPKPEAGRPELVWIFHDSPAD
jgi:hypothetical protein